MKFLKEYKIFETENTIEYSDREEESVRKAKENLNNIIQEISIYNSKKRSVENLILNNRGDNKKDISKQLDNVITDPRTKKENRFLRMFITIVEKEKQILNLEDRLEYYSDLRKERKGDLSATSKLDNIEEKNEQKKKLNEQLKDISEKTKDINSKIKDLNKEIQENKKNLDKHIKETKKDFETSLKNTNIKLKS